MFDVQIVIVSMFVFVSLLGDDDDDDAYDDSKLPTFDIHEKFSLLSLPLPLTLFLLHF